MRVGKDFGVGRRFLALVAAVCTLGSLAVTPLANAADTMPQADACVPVSTRNDDGSPNTDAFTWVNGTVRTVKLNTGKCYDLTVKDTFTLWQGGSGVIFNNVTVADNVKQFEIHGNTTVNSVSFENHDAESPDLTFGVNQVSGLKRIVYPKRMKTVPHNGVYKNPDLEELDFSATGVKSLGNVQSNPKLRKVVLPPHLTSIGQSGLSENSSLSEVTFPDDYDASSLTLYWMAFNSSKFSFADFKFPESLKTIDVYGAQSQHAGFAKTLTFPKNMDSLKLRNDAFVVNYNAPNGLKTVVLPETIKDLSIGSRVFNQGIWPDYQSQKYPLETVTLPKSITGSATIANAFTVPNYWSYGEGFKTSYRIPAGADEDMLSKILFTGNAAWSPITDAAGGTVIPRTEGAAYMLYDFGRPYPDAPAKTSPNIQLAYDSTSKTWSGTTAKRWAQPGYELTGWKLYEVNADGALVDQNKTLNPGEKVTVPHGVWRLVAQWKQAEYKLDYGSTKVPESAPTSYTYQRGVKLPEPSETPEGQAFRGWTWVGSKGADGSSPLFGTKYDNAVPAKSIAPETAAGDLTLTPVFVSVEANAKLDELQKLVDEGLKAQGNLSKPGYAYVNDAKDPFLEALKNAQDVLAKADGNTTAESVQQAYDKLKEAFDALKLVPVTAPSSASGVVTIPTVNGVDYQVDGKTVTGTVTVPSGGTVTVTAVPQKGYAFTAGTTTSFSFSYDHTVTPSPSPSPSPNPNPTPSVKMVDVRRLYNPQSGEHFYTAGMTEYTVLVNAGWRDEGIGFTMAAE